jgi:hypothetical protein
MAAPSPLNFENIWAAAFALFSSIPGLNTTSRRLVTWDKVSPEDQPALFQRELRFTAVQNHLGVTAKWNLFGEIVVYVNAGSDPDIVPSQALNAVILAVNNIFEPPPNARQTLGIPNVTEAVILGDILIDEGVTDGQSIALIPFRITAH